MPHGVPSTSARTVSRDEERKYSLPEGRVGRKRGDSVREQINRAREHTTALDFTYLVSFGLAGCDVNGTNGD